MMWLFNMTKIIKAAPIDHFFLSRLSEILKDKVFWIWDKQQHKVEDIKTGGDCCCCGIQNPPYLLSQ
jgi:hypothetical protein